MHGGSMPSKLLQPKITKCQHPQKLVETQSHNLNGKRKIGLQVNNDFYVRDFWMKEENYFCLFWFCKSCNTTALKL